MIELSQTYVVEQHTKEKIQSCVEKGFGFLAESARVSVFWHLENDFKITRDSMIERPAEFVSSLRQIFGEGADLVERKISSEICRSFAISLVEDLNFPQVVDLAKKKAQTWEKDTRNWKNF